MTNSIHLDLNQTLPDGKTIGCQGQTAEPRHDA
jgi:hypothetical protein